MSNFDSPSNAHKIYYKRRIITLKALIQQLVAQLLQAAVSDAVEMRLACWTRRIQTSLCHPQVAAVAKEVAFRALEDVT